MRSKPGGGGSSGRGGRAGEGSDASLGGGDGAHMCGRGVRGARYGGGPARRLAAAGTALANRNSGRPEGKILDVPHPHSGRRRWPNVLRPHGGPRAISV